MKSAIYLLYILVLVSLCFTGCKSSTHKNAVILMDDSVAFDSSAIQIGYLPTLDALPLLVAYEDGLLDSLKVDVQLVQFTSNMDIDTAFLNRRIHGALTDVCRAILLNSKNNEIRIVGKTDGVSYLVSQQKLRIRKVNDLNERMIAIARNEASDWMLDILLGESKMEPSDVNRPQINNIQLRQEMVQKEMIDAAILPEPYATMAMVNGDRQMWDNKNRQTGCIIFTHKVLVDRETELRKIAQAYDIAAKRINNSSKDRYARLMQKMFSIDKQVTDSLELPQFSTLEAPENKIIEEAVNWLKNRYDEADWLGFRILKTDYKPTHLIDTRLIQENNE